MKSKNGSATMTEPSIRPVNTQWLIFNLLLTMTICWHFWRNVLYCSKNVSLQRLMKSSRNWPRKRTKSLRILLFQRTSIALSTQSTLIQRQMRLTKCYSLAAILTYSRLLSPQISSGKTVNLGKTTGESDGSLSRSSWYSYLLALLSLLSGSSSANS